MEDADFNELAGRDDALYRTLGLLIRQLHVRNIIEAPDLVREMRLLAGQLDGNDLVERNTIAGIEGIAASIEREQAQWAEGRVVSDLYRATPGKDRCGR